MNENYNDQEQQGDFGNQYIQPPHQPSYGQPGENPPPQVPYQSQSPQQPYLEDRALQPIPLQPKHHKPNGRPLLAILVVVLLGVTGLLSYGVVKIIRGGGRLNWSPEGVASSFFSGNKEAGDAKQSGNTPKDDTNLVIEDTPSGDKSVAALPGMLTSVQVGKKIRDSNVAVQVFDERNSPSGEGSGIVIHESADHAYTYVVTCAHVIDRAKSVSIELENGESYPAEIVGYDSRTDVGLLRVKKTGLSAATFGDSSQLEVGEPVYAIGNPGGVEFKGSLTVGIVSAIDRPITSRYKMVTIQHTAQINPGNSGGALVNALGQVIGINSQKIVDAEYEGMGFAVPSKIVKEVVDGLIKNGYVPNRPKLGIQYIAASQTSAGTWVVRSNGLPSGSLIIAEIDPDSILSGTSVQKNDIITHVNGVPLNRPEVLLRAVEDGNVGDVLKLKLARLDAETYRISTFEVQAKLVEDKGTSAPQEPVTSPWWKEEEAFGSFP